MIIYLLKFVFCTGILYLFYYLVLRNERLFRFNRIFLLSIVLLAAIIPVVTVKTKTIAVLQGKALSIPQATLSEDEAAISSFRHTPESLDLGQLLFCIYAAIAAFLCIRLMINLWSLNRFKMGGKITHQHGLYMVLRSDVAQSFSFMQFMYTNKEQYEQGILPDEVIAHEKAHIDQGHSYDILFMELITCLCWFNPIIYPLKRAIQLNHEFLADDTAISKTGSLSQYQNTIIRFASQSIVPSNNLASHLTFGETKKRINIMAKTTNKQQNLIRQSIALAMVISLFAILGKTEIRAQSSSTPPPIKNGTQSKTQVQTPEKPQQKPAKLVIPDIPSKIHVLDDQTLNPSSDSDRDLPKSGSAVYPKNLRWSDPEGNKGTFDDLPQHLKSDFLAGKPIIARIWFPPIPRRKVTQEMLDDFLDSKKYGVWLDGKRIKNEELANLAPSEIHSFFQSVLREKAKDYGKYTYHLNIDTEAYMKDKSDGHWLDVKLENLKLINEKKLEEARKRAAGK